MSNGAIKISVIMPSYNKAAYIGKTIESVISQTYQNWELIIVDDFSTDESMPVISAYKDNRIKLTRNERNRGIADTRNRVLSMAEGEYIAVWDADDLSPDYRFAHEVDRLDNDPNISVVYGGCQEIDKDDNYGKLYISPFHNPAFVKANLLVRDVVPNSSAMYRRDFVEKNRICYRNALYGMDDYMFWVECAARGNIAGIPETMLYWRNLNDNETAHVMREENAQREKAYRKIQKEALKLFGFELNEKELEIYHRYLAESPNRLSNYDEIDRFLCVMKKLCEQAEHKKERAEYIKVFRREFGRALEDSYIWNQHAGAGDHG